ncbi:MAG: ribonuclease P protein component [Oscillospiraceae bacterium]|nr:ribonuclease P protein component [Oscillospiraceae bacterium]
MICTTSIKQNYEFRRVYNNGKSVATGLIAVYCRKNRRGMSRLGITVGTKVGKAVVRNKVRRRLREIYRHCESSIRRGQDIVIVARVKSRYAAYSELERDFCRMMDKLGLWEISGAGKP